MGHACRGRWKGGIRSFRPRQSLCLRNHIPGTSKQLLLAWDCSARSLADPNTSLMLRQFSRFFVLAELMIIRYRRMYCAVLYGLGDSCMDLIN